MCGKLYIINVLNEYLQCLLRKQSTHIVAYFHTLHFRTNLTIAYLKHVSYTARLVRWIDEDILVKRPPNSGSFRNKNWSGTYNRRECVYLETINYS